jgi:hypothetical protein
MGHFIVTYGLLAVFVLMVADSDRYRFEDGVAASATELDEPGLLDRIRDASPTHAWSFADLQVWHPARLAPQFVRINASYRRPRPVGGDSPW